MAIFTDSKSGFGSQYPTNAVDAQPIGRVEALLTPEHLKARYLFGIPLYSATRDPLTNRYAEMTDEHLNDFIEGAVNRCELDLKFNIFAVQRKERHEYDALHFKSFLYFKTSWSPILSVDRVAIETANRNEIFVAPPEWIEAGGFLHGQINLIPLAIAAPSVAALGGSAGGVGGLIFIGVLGNQGYVPAFWSVTYTTGFPDGKIPRVINDLIGITAAIEVLSMLAATRISTSTSLGLDGISQSVGTPGPQIYQGRIQELQEQRKAVIGKVQALFGKRLVVADL